MKREDKEQDMNSVFIQQMNNIQEPKKNSLYLCHFLWTLYNSCQERYDLKSSISDLALIDNFPEGKRCYFDLFAHFIQRWEHYENALLSFSYQCGFTKMLTDSKELEQWKTLYSFLKDSKKRFTEV